MTGLPYDAAAAVQHLSDNDPIMAQLAAEIGPFNLEFRGELSPFQALLQSIVYQQLSGHAAGSIYRRLQAFYGDRLPTPAALLDTPDDQLRSCGLSRAKVRAVKDLAEKTSQNLLPTPARIAHMENDEIVSEFSAVRGIGPWTVEMLMIFNLGRPDILPITDLGVRRGFSVAYQTGRLPTSAELLAHGECWRPYRSVASWYLWQAADATFRADTDC